MTGNMTAQQLQDQLDTQTVHQHMHVVVNLAAARKEMTKQAVKASQKVVDALDHTIINVCAAIDRLVEKNKPQAH